MKAQELMTSKVHSVGSWQSLNDAARLMWEHNCGSVPVLDENNKVVGMVTDRDIAMAAYLNGNRLEAIPVSVAQSKQIICCKPSDSINDVQHMMQTYQMHRIPVVGKKGELAGIVSLNDIACAYQSGVKGLTAEEVSDTLASICGSMKKTNLPTTVALKS